VGGHPRECQALTLEVRSSNVGAQALYRRFGFAPVGVRQKYYENTEDAIVMWCHDIAEPPYRDRLHELCPEAPGGRAVSDLDVSRLPLRPSGQPIGPVDEHTLVLGIETSCDETAAALVLGGYDVASSVVSTQVDLHAQYGGVVPEIASRAHLDMLNPIIARAIVEAGVPRAGSTPSRAPWVRA
jgi:hypothetical protein